MIKDSTSRPIFSRGRVCSAVICLALSKHADNGSRRSQTDAELRGSGGPCVLTGPGALGVNTTLVDTQPGAAGKINEQYELTPTGCPGGVSRRWIIDVVLDGFARVLK